MPDIEDIKAKKGDLVLPKWKNLIEFIRNTGVVTGPGVRIRQGPNGTYVYAEKTISSFNHPFKVTVSNLEASVTNGTVNGVSPRLKGIPISGVAKDGRELEVPTLPIEMGEDNKSYIAIRTRLEPNNGFWSISDDTTYIQSYPSIDPTFLQGGSTDIAVHPVGLYPIAIVYWEDEQTVRKVHQVVHHNLNHRYIDANMEEGYPSRHLFWAA